MPTNRVPCARARTHTRDSRLRKKASLTPSLPRCAQVITSLTIPFWVPILERFTGRYGIYWVFSVLTYYAYLAWVIFAVLLCALLYQWPAAGALWLGIVVLRVVQFARMGARKPAGFDDTFLAAFTRPDEEAPLPLATESHASLPSLAPVAAAKGAGGVAVAGSSDGCLPAHRCPLHGSSGGGRIGACDVDGGAGGSCAECGSSMVGQHGHCCSGCASDGRPGPRLGSVVLVGNGPSIRERGLGSVIDGFDTVVRFNSFVTKGLEEHTGSKTSLWCHMMQWYHVSTVEIAQKAAWLPTCYAWNHVVLAPLVFVPNYLMPMLPPRGAITWSLATYWRAHRALGLRLHQVPLIATACHCLPLIATDCH